MEKFSKRYSVKIGEDVSPAKARAWCKKIFGPIPVKEISAVRNGRFYKSQRVFYNHKEATWMHHLNDEKTNRTFRFKSPEDALVFKMVWG